MLNLYLIYFGYGMILNIITYLIFISTIGAIVSPIVIAISYDSDIRHTENTLKIRKISIKTTKIFTIILLVFSLLRMMLPSRNESLIMLSLYAGDKYLADHPNSALHPKKIINMFDESAKELETFITRLPKVLNKGLDKLESKTK
jgi:hypothetical protein